MTGVNLDITTEKQAEKILREKDRLKGVLEMAGAVCHEMNQPLMAISGMTELLALKLPDQHNSNNSIRNIKNQIDRMGKITSDFMNITRYETKQYLGEQIIDIDKAASKLGVT